mmetsp:Transcript_5649/g.17880  ORF Transcript_5649/g.17880 Transcript_5649/m.17880 type:complete len:237 (+) Transcript_5649:2018-2728(+)
MLRKIVVQPVQPRHTQTIHVISSGVRAQPPQHAARRVRRHDFLEPPRRRRRRRRRGKKQQQRQFPVEAVVGLVRRGRGGSAAAAVHGGDRRLDVGRCARGRVGQVLVGHWLLDRRPRAPRSALGRRRAVFGERRERQDRRRRGSGPLRGTGRRDGESDRGRTPGISADDRGRAQAARGVRTDRPLGDFRSLGGRRFRDAAAPRSESARCCPSEAPRSQRTAGQRREARHQGRRRQR